MKMQAEIKPADNSIEYDDNYIYEDTSVSPVPLKKKFRNRLAVYFKNTENKDFHVNETPINKIKIHSMDLDLAPAPAPVKKKLDYNSDNNFLPELKIRLFDSESDEIIEHITENKDFHVNETPMNKIKIHPMAPAQAQAPIKKRLDYIYDKVFPELKIRLFDSDEIIEQIKENIDNSINITPMNKFKIHPMAPPALAPVKKELDHNFDDKILPELKIRLFEPDSPIKPLKNIPAVIRIQNDEVEYLKKLNIPATIRIKNDEL